MNFAFKEKKVNEVDTAKTTINLEQKEIIEALKAADNALNSLRRARECLENAQGWGAVDIVGGGLVSGMIKHDNIGNAEWHINKAREAMKKLNDEIKDVPNVNSVKISNFLSFSDVFMDNFFSDILVQTEIHSSKKNIHEAILKVMELKYLFEDSLTDSSKESYEKYLKEMKDGFKENTGLKHVSFLTGSLL